MSVTHYGMPLNGFAIPVNIRRELADKLIESANPYGPMEVFIGNDDYFTKLSVNIAICHTVDGGSLAVTPTIIGHYLAETSEGKGLV